jgi:hypothetical protein
MTTESNATATTRAEERRRRELYKGMDAADLAREALNLAREALDVNEDRRDWLGYVAAMESVLAQRTRADDDQGDDQEPEPSAPRRASNGTPDDDDREQDDDAIRSTRAARPLFRQVMTFTAPADDDYEAESVTLEIVVTHERMAVAQFTDLRESETAGWRGWGFRNFDVNIRALGD